METTSKSFADVGIAKELVDILAQKEITAPSPIQSRAIPEVLSGDDVLGVAKTGTGKTLAFLLPLIQNLKMAELSGDASAQGSEPKLLIVLPTRELAFQVHESVEWFEGPMKMRSAVIVGGVNVNQQVKALARHPQIVIGTPGRLNDLLEQRKLNLSKLKHVVLDEADRMFDMGFEPQIRRVLQHAPKREDRQTLLFSATMPPSIVKLVQQYMRTPTHIEIATHGSTADKVEQEIIILSQNDRKDALVKLLKQTDGAVIVFTRTKYQARNLNRWLRDGGYKSEELHGNRSVPQRKRAIAALQSKQSRILVATDIAARGIDIDHVELVINYDLPAQAEDYVHRIGRTGRAGRSGRAVSLVLPDQYHDLKDVERLLKKEINRTSIDGIASAELDKNAPRKKQGGGNRGGRGRGGRRGHSGAGHGHSRGRGGYRGGQNRTGGRGQRGSQGRNRNRNRRRQNSRHSQS